MSLDWYLGNDVRRDTKEIRDMVEFLWSACEKEDQHKEQHATFNAADHSAIDIRKIFRENVGFTRFEFGKYRDFVAASFYVMLVAYLEDRLLFLTKQLSQALHGDFEPRSKKIKTCIDYIKEHARIECSRKESQRIEEMIDRRNDIVHELMNSNSTQKQFYNTIRKKEIVEMLEFISGFLTRIIDDMFKYCPNAVYLVLDDR